MVVKSSYRLISLISSVITGAWPLLSVGERGACDEADKPENRLQRRFSGGSEGEETGDNEAGIELVSLS